MGRKELAADGAGRGQGGRVVDERDSGGEGERERE